MDQPRLSYAGVGVDMCELGRPPGTARDFAMRVVLFENEGYCCGGYEARVVEWIQPNSNASIVTTFAFASQAVAHRRASHQSWAQQMRPG